MKTHPQNDVERRAAALARYHTHYNNDSYRAVQVALIGDLHGEPFAKDTGIREQLLAEETPQLLMNLLTDLALHICGLPDMDGKMQQLVNHVVQQQLSPETVRLMSQYLEQFEAYGSSINADFENTALALVHAGDGRAELVEGIALSSAIHSAKGRAAHYLLKAAAAFIHAAELLLKAENSQSYLNEKLAQGTSALADAVTEIQQD